MVKSLMAVLLVLVCELAAGQGKLSPGFETHLKEQQNADSIELTVQFQNTVPRDSYFRLLHSSTPVPIAVIKLHKADLAKLLSDTLVRFANPAHQPKEELATGAVDYTLNAITYTQHLYPLLTGQGLNASVKERLFDTTDIDLKGRVIKTGLEHSLVTAHASLMATIIGGGGNSSPIAKGTATGATLTSTSFTNLLPEPSGFYTGRNITVQNHSYGTVVENYYGNEATAFDASAMQHPSLLYVFSAGNSGMATAASGSYVSTPGWSNLTGNFKHGKNNLVVGALDSTGAPGLSSKGPAFDGRIKPELSAYGEDGSSGAAALVSGTALLLQHSFRNRTGALPSSSLLRAVLINSANYINARPVDFRWGFGSLNAYKAVQTIEEGRWLEDSLPANASKTFLLSIPAGIKKLKVTLAWTDAPAPVSASKALVNNLDMRLQHAFPGTTWLPWVNSSFPHQDSLLSFPARRADTLNTVEHISVDDPTPGTYSVEIRSGQQSGSQAFSLAWQLDTAGTFRWTFPSASDPLLTGRNYHLRWQTAETGPATLSYALNGSSWVEAGTISSLAQGWFRWTPPDTTALLQFRITTGAGIFYSDTALLHPALELQTAFQCNDSFMLKWNSIGTAYRLSTLNGSYLQPGSVVSDTVKIIRRDQAQSSYFAVAPVYRQRTGVRSQTINYAAQGTECYLRNFFLQSQSGKTAAFAASVGTLFNLDAIIFEKLEQQGPLALQVIRPSGTLQLHFTDTALHQGENRFRLKLVINGASVYSNLLTVYVAGSSGAVIYPNPVLQGEAVRIIPSETGRYTLTVYNTLGKLIGSMLVNSQNFTVPTSRWPKGYYLFQLADRNGTRFTRKILVQ